jgi:hypothetical protein
VVAQIKLAKRLLLPQPERIEVGDLMAAKAVGIDELQHPHLLLGNIRCSGRLRRAPRRSAHARELPKLLSDLFVRDVRGTGCGTGQCLKVALPNRVDPARIAKKGFVECFEIGRVQHGQWRAAPPGVQGMLGGVVHGKHRNARPKWPSVLILAALARCACAGSLLPEVSAWARLYAP